MDGLTTAGLFAGIGGIELGLEQAGHRTVMLCEFMPEAQRVLREHFHPEVFESDIRTLAQIPSRKLPDVDIVAAGFPCQDLSQAGRTAGIGGRNSGLVDCLFALLARRRRSPRWVLIENVPFMLQLDRGRAMAHLTSQLESLGFRWAYRTIDTMAFGLPHRRRRVILLASRTEDPREVLFTSNETPRIPRREPDTPCGFYWTEGVRGLGWAIDAVPTLKGGSTIGIPSPPAIWFPDEDLAATPDLRDAERLQGFPADWTAVACEERKRNGPRWKLVGNAVSVPVARWVGERLLSPAHYHDWSDPILRSGQPWPYAAWGGQGRAYAAELSAWPVRRRYTGLREFLDFELRPLSVRATEGFLARTDAGRLNFSDGFIESLRRHLEAVRTSVALPIGNR